jgi:hypothetical protein
MAFDASLFGRSRILSLKNGSDLIEQALGYVETAVAEEVDAVKVCLAERLVVDIIMNVLEKTRELNPLVNEYLYENQFHEGAFGDSAEVALAASVRELSSQTLPQSERFTSSFESVYRISAGGCAFRADPQLGNCFFEAGSGVLRDYRPINGKELGLTEWLRRVRKEAPRPTFLFPEQIAGPDLMFVFREAGGTRRVVFAVQVRNPSSRDLRSD